MTRNSERLSCPFAVYVVSTGTPPGPLSVEQPASSRAMSRERMDFMAGDSAARTCRHNRPMLHRTLLALCVGVFSLAATAQDALPPAVLAALKAADLPAEALSAAAVPLNHRAPPWRYRALDPVQPGSSMK